jgi:UDP-N-acetylglucosamine pyrophosphorylase
MEKSYPIMKVSCNACHVKGEKKTVRNEFGEMFFKILKEDELTQNWKEAKTNGRDAQKAYEKETMLPLFQKALKEVKADTVPEVEGTTNPDAGQTWDEMIKQEKVDGIKVDQRKKEKLEKEAAEKAAGGSGSASKAE